MLHVLIFAIYKYVQLQIKIKSSLFILFFLFCLEDYSMNLDSVVAETGDLIRVYYSNEYFFNALTNFSYKTFCSIRKTSAHIGYGLKDVAFNALYKHVCIQRQQNALKYVTEEWSQIEYELLRERGLWGPPIGSHLDKWMLEMTEGPCRMRKKMVRNDMFYTQYPYMPEAEQETNLLVSNSRFVERNFMPCYKLCFFKVDLKMHILLYWFISIPVSPK